MARVRGERGSGDVYRLARHKRKPNSDGAGDAQSLRGKANGDWCARKRFKRLLKVRVKNAHNKKIDTKI